MSNTLREYQQTLINKTKQALLSGYKSPCIVAPCGAGKSVMIAEIVKSATDKRNHVLFLVHRKELIGQIDETLRFWGCDMNYVHLGMVQTIVRRLDKLFKPALIITDENHHSLANSYKKIYQHFSDVKRVGFTATPVRLNGGGLGDVNDILIEEVTAKWLIENQFLAPYKYYAPEVIDTERLKMKNGEYVIEDVNNAFNENKVWGDVITHYKKLANNEQAICYCVNLEQSKKMAHEFCINNIQAKHIDAKTPKTERNRIIKLFKQGAIKILCNVDLIGEGFNVPDCSTVILLRPTQSLSLYIQQAMRGMRYRPNKISTIIDHVGNVGRFGLPDNERVWVLDPKKDSNKKKDNDTIKIKICTHCYATNFSVDTHCQMCGKSLKVERERHIVYEENSELKQIDVFEPVVVDVREPKDCKTMSELYELARNRGYKNGWAYHQGKILGLLGGK